LVITKIHYNFSLEVINHLYLSKNTDKEIKLEEKSRRYTGFDLLLYNKLMLLNCFIIFNLNKIDPGHKSAHVNYIA